jgi:anaerobic magnesium-protoporphyrin IX monomethyl ester cyclase
MNILLISLPNICTGYPTNIVMAPHLGLSSIAGNLDKKHNVKIADLVLKRKNIKEAVLESLRETKPDIVGLSAMTFQYKTSMRIARFIKEMEPSIRTALGGYHVSLLYEEIAESEDARYFDFLFRGESDLSFNEAVAKLDMGEDLRTVRGLSFKRKGIFIHNAKRELEDLAHIRLPDRSARLWNNFNFLRVPFDLIEYSRGCLMSCNFCNIRSMYGKSFRTFEIERVMRDIESAKKQGIKILFFVDDNITLDRKKFELLCDAIIENGHNDLLYVMQSGSAGIASSERLVEKMARAGCKMVFMGIENASRKNLKDLNKGDIVDKSALAAKLLNQYGILLAGGFIIGNPQDDPETIEDTFHFAKKIGTDFGGIQILVPYPKTEIRETLMDSGLITNFDDYDYYEGSYSNVKTFALDSEELKFLKYKLTRKYFAIREINVLKKFPTDKKLALKFLLGGVKLIPDIMRFGLNEKIKRMFLSEKQIYERYLCRERSLNKFNI